MPRNLRVVFIGYGAINSRVGELLKQRGAPVEIVGVATRDDPVERARIPQGVKFLASPAELAALKPDLVIEAAGRAAIDAWAPAALAAAPCTIIASTSAFTDDALLPRLLAIADKHGSRILLPSGAIGGIDAHRQRRHARARQRRASDRQAAGRLEGHAGREACSTSTH